MRYCYLILSRYILRDQSCFRHRRLAEASAESQEACLDTISLGPTDPLLQTKIICWRNVGWAPTETIITPKLLCACLLISPLVTFTAMLNQYLWHAGGLVIECCGDHQRKFEGVEMWSFHLFVECLLIMPQTVLFTYGLSWYMWFTNTLVARIVFFTVLYIPGTHTSRWTSSTCTEPENLGGGGGGGAQTVCAVSTEFSKTSPTLKPLAPPYAPQACI